MLRRIFDPKVENVRGIWGKLQDEEFHNLSTYSVLLALWTLSSISFSKNQKNVQGATIIKCNTRTPSPELVIIGLLLALIIILGHPHILLNTGFG